MRKLIQMLVIACMVVLGTQVALANADKETLMEGADITTINRIAVGAPLYQAPANAPGNEMLAKIMADSGRVSRSYVVSYDAVAETIKATKGVDITLIDRRKASKIFKENLDSLADAYVILTVANNSRTAFFFDVYKVGTNDLLYTYMIIANKSEDNSEKTYANFCEQFYKHFDRAAEAQLKKQLKGKF